MIFHLNLHSSFLIPHSYVYILVLSIPLMHYFEYPILQKINLTTEIVLIIIIKVHRLLTTRATIEYEKKGYAENYEHGQMMEKKLVSMARELEKLRAEMANAEKRARAAAAVGNPGMFFFESGDLLVYYINILLLFIFLDWLLYVNALA